MQLKLRPNDEAYLAILRRMTPEERLRKAFELTDFSRQLFMAGLRERHPTASDEEFRNLVAQRLLACHNRTC